ncbi:MAG TPA: FHA domain-containing protein [Fimbriiglobus sp.]|jgi:pSer/pThr/pTyr-binding forkhead associated (FHA) protein
MNARLIPNDGGTPVELRKEMTLVGRNDDCDIFLDHKSVSKLHCILVMTDGLILVRDLGSTNGTRVNGQRVRRAALLPNDHLAIANFKYQVLFGPELEPEAVGAAEQTGALQRNALPDDIG